MDESLGNEGLLLLFRAISYRVFMSSSREKLLHLYG